MKQTFKLTTFCLSMGMLFNGIAQETTEPVATPPQTIPKPQTILDLPSQTAQTKQAESIVPATSTTENTSSPSATAKIEPATPEEKPKFVTTRESLNRAGMAGSTVPATTTTENTSSPSATTTKIEPATPEEKPESATASENPTQEKTAESTVPGATKTEKTSSPSATAKIEPATPEEKPKFVTTRESLNRGGMVGSTVPATTTTEKTSSPPATTTKIEPTTQEEKPESATTSENPTQEKTAESTVPTTTTTPENPVQDKTIEKLKTVVAQYVTAWQKEDFNTMLQFENWEKGEKLGIIKYIQSFDAKFDIKEWEITKTEPAENNEYQVLVLVSHELPAKIAALVKRNQMIKSTIVQWWRKEGEKFVHLFYIEQERHMKFLSTMDSLTSSPVLKK